MPWAVGAKDNADCYNVPLSAPANHDCVELNEYRKWCMQSAEQFKKMKHLAPDFFKEESNYWRKCYKGACYAIGWLSNKPSGDCIDVQPSQELAPFIDAAFYRVIYPQIERA